MIGDGCWPALVDEEAYWACVRLLEDPARLTYRRVEAAGCAAELRVIDGPFGHLDARLL